MTSSLHHSIAFALLFLSASTPLCVSAAAPAKPNVVYIMADDVGWGDLSVHSGGVPTPNIDKLFSEGVELTQFMGWCVCSPTRAMLLTGRHPMRVGTAPEVGGELALEETTIAEGFKSNGYRTGVFGKWHNGEDPDTPEFQAAFKEAFKSMPNKTHKGGHGANAHGFDEAWIYYGGGADSFNRRTVQGRGPVSWWHNAEFRGNDEGYTDDLVTQRAIEFIRTSSRAERDSLPKAARRDGAGAPGNGHPFFCYVPFHIAHAPLQAKEADLAAISSVDVAKLHAASDKTPEAEKRIHAAMLHSMDNNIAAIRAELENLGLSENTIFVFTSDNGAMAAGSSLPLRGHKHTIYDGGLRLPTAVHWPKGGLVGGKKWDGLCGALDMFPTRMAMTGSTMPETRPLDGKNIWPALRDRQPSPVESYYFVWHDEDALRTPQWKLHRLFNRFELYDITKDETESKNIADANPDVVKSLAAKMDASSAATRPPVLALPTATASGSTASSASAAPPPVRSVNTASSSPAARQAPSPSISTTSASATTTAARRRSGPAARTPALASSRRMSSSLTSRFARSA